MSNQLDKAKRQQAIRHLLTRHVFAVNLDGKVIAAGPNNAVNFSLFNSFICPGNVNLASNYLS